nr:NrsF family protein [Aestuariivirga sp. YIM B02566]
MVQDRAAVAGKPRGALSVALVGGALIAAILFLTVLGYRPDIAAAAETYRFLFKFVFTLTLAATTIWLIFTIVRPEAVPGLRLLALAAAPVLIILAVVAELSVMPSSTWLPRLIGKNWWFCLTVIPSLAIVPLAAFLMALRRAAPADPGLAGALAGLASGAIAATLYASHCTDDSPLFVLTWYSLAIGIVTIVGYFAGRRWLAW